jgi:hypothetical protein
MAATPEQRARYTAARRAKYTEDPEYRASVLKYNKERRDRNREAINAAKRQRWKTDDEYRERQLAPRRGRDQKEASLKHNYGLSLEQYNKMRANQARFCAICFKPEDILCVDHCHKTGTVRELLCRRCNTGLGAFRDSPELLRLGALYVERHRGNH